MIFVGCDFHSRYEQIACVDTDTGDLIERRLEHENGEARAFYSCLPLPARVGVEATGNLPWFGRMLGELGHELIVGDAAKIRAMVVRRQKTDSRDASTRRSSRSLQRRSVDEVRETCQSLYQIFPAV